MASPDLPTIQTQTSWDVDVNDALQLLGRKDGPAMNGSIDTLANLQTNFPAASYEDYSCVVRELANRGLYFSDGTSWVGPV